MKDFFIIKVGTDERPASQKDIDDFKEQFEKFCKESGFEDTKVFVTHHTVDFTRLEIED